MRGGVWQRGDYMQQCTDFGRCGKFLPSQFLLFSLAFPNPLASTASQDAALYSGGRLLVLTGITLFFSFMEKKTLSPTS